MEFRLVVRIKRSMFRLRRHRWFLYREDTGKHYASGPVYGFKTYEEAFENARAALGNPVIMHDADGFENFAGFRDFAD